MTNLIIGSRMAPQIILRAADARPFELQDLLPSDTRFKVIVFSGNLEDETQLKKVESFAKAALGKEPNAGGFLRKFGRKRDGREVFDVLTIMSGKKEMVNHTIMPEELVSHWSK